MTRKHTRKFLWSAGIVALIVAFIWGNSLLPQAQSKLESDFVLRVLRRIFGAHLDQATASHLVRKAAHFTEYALLGFAGAALFLSGRRGLQPRLLPHGPVRLLEILPRRHGPGGGHGDLPG